jgi:hypothetical protein
MSLRLQFARFAGAGICAIALANCGGSRTTTNSAQVTTGKSSAGPVFAQSLVLQPVSGTVRIELSSAAGYVRLHGVRQVRLGTVIDVRAGVVRLTAASPTPGKFAAGDFQGGVFQPLQSRSGNGLTDLKIQDSQSEGKACTGTNGRRQPTTRQLGELLGDAEGPFRTRGDRSSASSLGTKWGVRNRCDGTLTIVRSGTMAVTDFRLHKTVTLHAGQTYLAKPA